MLVISVRRRVPIGWRDVGIIGAGDGCYYQFRRQKLLSIMDRKKIIFYALFILGLCVLAYLIISSKILENLEIFRQMNFFLLLVALLLTNLNVLIKIYRWKYLCKTYGTDIPFNEAGKTVIGSFFVSGITPAKIGDVLKAYIMKKRYSMPFINGITGILYERVFELTLLFLVSLGVFYIGMSAKNYIILQLTSFVLIFIVVAYLFSDKILVWAEKIFIKLNIVNLKENDLRITKISPASAFYVFLLTALALGLEFIRLWLVVLAVGFTMNPIHLSVFFCLAILIGLLSQIPTGVGVVEGSLALFLVDEGLSSYYAFGIVLVDRLLSMYYVMGIGLLYNKWALTAAMEES